MLWSRLKTLIGTVLDATASTFALPARVLWLTAVFFVALVGSLFVRGQKQAAVADALQRLNQKDQTRADQIRKAADEADRLRRETADVVEADAASAADAAARLRARASRDPRRSGFRD